MPFPRFVTPISNPPPANEGCVDEAFFFVQCASIAKLVGKIHQHATQNLIAAPSLKAPMHSFVVRVALRQHVPLRACVENPKDRFKHTTRRSRFTPRTSIRNILLRKVIPDAFHLLVREPNHSTLIGSTAVRNFEIGSRDEVADPEPAFRRHRPRRAPRRHVDTVTHQDASASRLYVDAATRRLNAPEHASTWSRLWA